MMVFVAVSCTRVARDSGYRPQNPGHPAPVEAEMPFVSPPAYPYPMVPPREPAPGAHTGIIDPLAEASRLDNSSDISRSYNNPGYWFPLPEVAERTPAA